MELNRKALFVAVGAAGAASLLAQVVLLREILASAQGNELVLGIVLALWLLWTGAASALGARLRPGRAEQWLGPLLSVAPLLMLLSLWALAWSSPALGQSWSLRHLAASSLALLPSCALSGLAFAWALASVDERSGNAGLLYAIETLGAALAGAVFHVAFAERLGSAWILLVGGTACAVASIVQRRRWFMPALVTVLAVFAAPTVARSLVESRFPGEHVLALQPSRYGLLAVVARGSQRAFFHDGELLFTTEDQLVAEESVHLPLLLHPHPRRVLLIGGGLGGGLVEALKHRPDQIDYVEMDAAILSLARAFADDETRRALGEVRAITEDPRRVLAASAGKYDVILINVPIPQNALVARLLSRECFADARRALSPGGLLAVVTPGADSHLDQAARQRHASLLATLSTLFPAVGVAPGAETILWAADTPVDASPDVLSQRLTVRHLRLQQIGPTWLFDKLLPFHREEYRRGLAATAFVENRDLRPMVYLVGLLESLERLSPRLGRLGLWTAGLDTTWWAATIVLPLAALLFVRRRSARIVLVAVTAGGVGMTLQIVLLLLFQAVVGHLYYAVGALLASFMAGMAAGAWAARRLLSRPRVLARASAGVAAAALVVLAAILLARTYAGMASPILLAVSLVVGAAIGAVYPVTVHVAGAKSGARLYAWDLAGSAAAAVLASTLAIPALGLVTVTVAAAAVATIVASVARDVA